ncbi:hypothetical protein [Pseudogemmobacter bohemicus]|uniref:hypothetical protein n=1 Tax=Pseudogemmobacter bohemicus TaxID=2250708 RepID=UPI000DD33801|nr:hypothetical protein [Pseudogemmobacter bohemicus]
MPQHIGNDPRLKVMAACAARTIAQQAVITGVQWEQRMAPKCQENIASSAGRAAEKVFQGCVSANKFPKSAKITKKTYLFCGERKRYFRFKAPPSAFVRPFQQPARVILPV